MFEAMQDGLRKAFIYVGYPAVIVVAFLVIASRMRALFIAYDFQKRIQWRLAVAGLLPVAVLTFVVVGEFPEGVLWMPTADQWMLQFVVGASLAIGTLEAAQHVSGTRQALTFMLYLSTLGTGLLYVAMQGELARFQPGVFAVVLAGGLHFVFRETETSEGESQELMEQEHEGEPPVRYEGPWYGPGPLARLRQAEERIRRQERAS